MAGGFSHEKSSFNRATQSLRQPGSTFKPFIYLTAFERGYDPTSPLLDTPISIDTGAGAPRWKPEGEGGWGLITARRALENSRNLASVRLLYDLNLDAVSATTAKFGLYDKLENYSAALGALETTDLKLTTAYAMMANGGYKIDSSFIDEIVDRNGKTIYQRKTYDKTDENRVDSPIPNAQLISVLQGVVKRGTAAEALSRIPIQIAGKTGTTNDNKDAWFVGFTPEIAVGVHVGFDKPAPLGKIETGGYTAAPIVVAFLQDYDKIHTPQKKEFTIPEHTIKIMVDSQSGEIVTKGGIEEIMPEPVVEKKP